MLAETAQAGNPDRQGEAGAFELLMMPWARSAGLHSMNTANVSGVDALRLNIAGAARINKTQVNLSHAKYLQGSGIDINAFGLSQRVGENGALAFSVMALDFGDIPITTTNQPEGTGANFSPRFINIGVGYSHVFENKISVGVLFRGVSEGIADLRASTFAVDAGVQYVTGEDDNFKLGISLRNVGGTLRFQGEGIVRSVEIPNGGSSYNLAIEERTAEFELQSQLNIGASYDFRLTDAHRITLVGNFTSNAFSQDQFGAGLEYSLKDIFILRGAYRYEVGSSNINEAPLYSGLAGGFSLQLPLNKEAKDKGLFGTQVGIDYAYRASKILGGTHNIGLRFDL
jgi:opacity protein-like surface antigen